MEGKHNRRNFINFNPLARVLDQLVEWRERNKEGLFYIFTPSQGCKPASGVEGKQQKKESSKFKPPARVVNQTVEWKESTNEGIF